MIKSVYRIDLRPFKFHKCYAVLVDRREYDIQLGRKLVLFVLRDEFNIDLLFRKYHIGNDDLLLNPIPLIESPMFDYEKLIWEYIGNCECDISIIENWAFKRHQYPGDSEFILKDDIWVVLHNDKSRSTNIVYSQKMDHLELFDFYPYSRVNIRIYIELLRIVDEDIWSDDILKGLYREDYSVRMIMNHMEIVTPYEDIPIAFRGVYMP